MLNTRGLQLTIYLIMHGTILALMVSYSASTFQLAGKAESQKKLGLKKIDLQKCSKMELYDIYITVHFTKVSAFQNEVYNKPLTYKNGLS